MGPGPPPAEVSPGLPTEAFRTHRPLPGSSYLGVQVASSGRRAPRVWAATARAGQALPGLAGALPRQARLGGGARPGGTCAAPRGPEDPPPSRPAQPRRSAELCWRRVRPPPRARALVAGEGARGVRSRAQTRERRRRRLRVRSRTNPPPARAFRRGSARPPGPTLPGSRRRDQGRAGRGAPGEPSREGLVFSSRPFLPRPDKPEGGGGVAAPLGTSFHLPLQSNSPGPAKVPASAKLSELCRPRRAPPACGDACPQLWGGESPGLPRSPCGPGSAAEAEQSPGLLGIQGS